MQRAQFSLVSVCRASHSFFSNTASLSILAKLTNYEQQGIPAGSGTTSACSTFDLGRMHRLLRALGGPHKQWPVIHVAGSKGVWNLLLPLPRL